MVGNSAVSALSLGKNETKELKITHRLNAPIGQYAVIIASATGDQATELKPYEYNAMSFWLRTPCDISSLNDDGITVATQGNDLYVGSTTPIHIAPSAPLLHKQQGPSSTPPHGPREPTS